MAFQTIAAAAALEEIWRTQAKRILRITQRITNNREDAEDALQESFLRAHVYLHRFDGRSSVMTWLTRIAINSALMIRRKRANLPPLVSIDDASEFGRGIHAVNPVDPSASPETQCVELERQAIVNRAIKSLRSSIREALELQTTEEVSVKEVAEKMGISLPAAKSRIFHAKAALQRSVSRRLNRRPLHSKQPELSAA